MVHGLSEGVVFHGGVHEEEVPSYWGVVQCT